MKNKIRLVAAALCIAAHTALAQTPVTPIPTHIPIGKMVIAEALARVAKIEILMTAPSATEEFRLMLHVDNIRSTEDVIDRMYEVEPQLQTYDPKDVITTSVVIYDQNDRKLFAGINMFKMLKVGYDANGDPVYQTPVGAEFMFFELMAEPIPFPGATEAWAVTLDGKWFSLPCFDEKIVVPGWMSLSNFSEVIVNGNLRYDMNTGMIMGVQNPLVRFSNVAFDGLEKVSADPDGNVTIYTQPRYGYAPLTEFNHQGGRFHLNFTTGVQWEESRPIAVRIATLNELKAGLGWKVHNFPEGGLILDLPNDTYYIYPEFGNDFGWGFPTIVAQG